MSTSTHSIPLIDDGAFEREIAAEGGILAVDFGADWCPPCRVMDPVVEAAARELTGRVRFLKMDADANPRTAIRYGVRALPTLVIFHGGREVDRIVGAQSLPVLRARIDRVIA